MLRFSVTPDSAVRVFLARRRWAGGDSLPGGGNGPHQGSQAGGNKEVRKVGDGHGLARGPDLDADGTDQRPDRAPADAREGSLLASRPAQARRPAAPVPELPAEEGSRGLSRPHQGARPAPLAPTPLE